MTNNKTTILNAINQNPGSGLSTGGNTYIPSGLTWGWNVLAAGDPFDTMSVADLNAKGGSKVLVLMTDGDNSLGINKTHGALVSMSDSTEADQLTADLCTNIKADGIKIFTVLFDVQDAGMKKMLEDCASDTSNAYDVSDGNALIKAFGSIGNQLKAVRISN